MSRRQLYQLAFVAMIIDHIGYFFYEIPCYELFRWIGRLAFPIFAFFLVEGYFHTHDLKKYKLRLFYGTVIIWILEIGRTMIHFFLNGILPWNFWDFFTGTLFDTNIFFTMLCGLYFLEGLDGIQKKQARSILMILCSSIFMIGFAEYGFYAWSYFFIFYCFRDTKLKFLISFLFFGIYSLLIGNTMQFFMIFANIPLFFYDGSLGKPFQNKYLFYWMYIGQLLVFYLVSDLYYGLL